MKFDISHANILHDNQDYTSFMNYCLSFEQLEDATIAYRMGNCYRKGNGITKDILKAIEYHSRAVALGSINAIIALAIIYSDEEEVQDINKCIMWYEKGVEKGSTTAMFNLGWVYQNIASVKDISKAIHWYSCAANNGKVDATVRLAMIYCDEEEVQDINKCIMWYEKGVEKGSTTAMFNLGWVYRNIASVKDDSKALYYYTLAANKGYAKGKYRAANLMLLSNVTSDAEKAYQWLFESAIADVSDALALLSKYAEEGSSIAQFYLGRYYTEKTDIADHKQTAFKWYNKSAMQGYVPAQNIILIQQAESTNQTVNAIKVDTTTIVDTTAENSRKLDAITSSLMSMNEEIAHIRATSFTGNEDAEDNEIGSALEKSAVVINNTVHDSPAGKLNKHTEHLIRLFGEQTWGRLLPETQQSLISSAYLLKECEGMPPDFDYSGICITAVVALEKELKRVFSDNFIKYLKEVRKVKDDQLPYLFQDKNYFFSLGKMATLFGYNVENDEIRYNYYAREMAGYLKTIVKKAYSYKPLFAFIDKNDPSCFVLRCLTINKSYRCKAAHSGNVSYDDALDCCYEIYGEASGHIEAKKQSAEIISLLRELFTILE